MDVVINTDGGEATFKLEPLEFDTVPAAVPFVSEKSGFCAPNPSTLDNIKHQEIKDLID